MKLFNKPDGISYTDMCIWIDENVYTQTCDWNRFAEYCYHIVRMLAYVNKYFSDANMYEDFSMFCVEILWKRYTNSKQYQLKDDGTPKLKKITSILNYIKHCIYFWKVRYQQQNFCQYNQTDNPKNPDSIENEHPELIQLGYDKKWLEFEFVEYISSISKVLRGTLRVIPEYSNSAEWNAIYLSCLLTLLSRMTIPNSVLSKLTSNKLNEDADILYQQVCTDAVVMYHLNPSRESYINVLCNKLKKKLAKQLSEIICSFETPESLTKIMILEGTDQLEED